MTVGLMRLHLGGELALCPRHLVALLEQHPGIGWARTFRVVWRRR